MGLMGADFAHGVKPSRRSQCLSGASLRCGRHVGDAVVKTPFGQTYHPVGLLGAGVEKHHVVGTVVITQITATHVGGEPVDALAAAKDRMGQRGTLKDKFVEVIKYPLGRNVEI